jgi:hypothetical protein
MTRLLTVIGHGIELLEHHIKHYQKYVDEINYVVYETDLYPSLANEVKEIVESYNNVKVVKVIKDRVFDWEKVTHLYNLIKYKKPNDWWVIADIDEFHLYPNNDLDKLISDCNNNEWELVRGGFIDRVGANGSFPELKANENIFQQFPVMSFFRYPMSNACPNKICVMKGGIEITSGQHYAKIDGYTTWRWQGWNHPLIAPVDTHSVQVHHFKWDSTCINRIMVVASIKQEYAYSNEYQKLYNELRKTKFRIDLDEQKYEVVLSDGYAEFQRYTKWNKLIKKIISI